MKLFSRMLFTLMALILVSCSKDGVLEFAPESPEQPDSQEQKVNTKLYTLSLDLNVDSIALKNIHTSSRVPSINQVFLIVNYDKEAQYQASLPFTLSPISGNWLDGGHKSSITLQIGQQSNGNIFISNGNKSVDVSGKAKCILSSHPNVAVSLSKGSPLQGVKGDVYDALGDKLFRTHGFHFYYGNEGPKWGSKSYYHYSIKFSTGSDADIYRATEESMKTDQLVFRKNIVDYKGLVFEMDRYTTSIFANIYMVDRKNILGIDVPINLDLGKKDFPGAMTDWKVTTLLGNAPSSYNLYDNVISSSNSNPYPYGNSYVKLGNVTAIGSAEVEFKLAAGWNNIPDILPSKIRDMISQTIGGIGTNKGETDEAFIFPMSINKTDGSVTSINYIFENTKAPKGYYTRKILSVPFTTLNINEPLKPNEKYEILIVIHINDFIKQMKKSIFFKNARSTESDMVMDIPYKAYVREIGN